MQNVSNNNMHLKNNDSEKETQSINSVNIKYKNVFNFFGNEVANFDIENEKQKEIINNSLYQNNSIFEDFYNNPFVKNWYENNYNFDENLTNKNLFTKENFLDSNLLKNLNKYDILYIKNNYNNHKKIQKNLVSSKKKINNIGNKIIRTYSNKKEVVENSDKKDCKIDKNLNFFKDMNQEEFDKNEKILEEIEKIIENNQLKKNTPKSKSKNVQDSLKLENNLVKNKIENKNININKLNIINHNNHKKDLDNKVIDINYDKKNKAMVSKIDKDKNLNKNEKNSDISMFKTGNNKNVYINEKNIKLMQKKLDKLINNSEEIKNNNETIKSPFNSFQIKNDIKKNKLKIVTNKLNQNNIDKKNLKFEKELEVKSNKQKSLKILKTMNINISDYNLNEIEFIINKIKLIETNNNNANNYKLIKLHEKIPNSIELPKYKIYNDINQIMLKFDINKLFMIFNNNNFFSFSKMNINWALNNIIRCYELVEYFKQINNDDNYNMEEIFFDRFYHEFKLNYNSKIYLISIREDKISTLSTYFIRNIISEINYKLIEITDFFYSFYIKIDKNKLKGSDIINNINNNVIKKGSYITFIHGEFEDKELETNKEIKLLTERNIIKLNYNSLRFYKESRSIIENEEFFIPLDEVESIDNEIIYSIKILILEKSPIYLYKNNCKVLLNNNEIDLVDENMKIFFNLKIICYNDLLTKSENNIVVYDFEIPTKLLNFYDYIKKSQLYNLYFVKIYKTIDGFYNINNNKDYQSSYVFKFNDQYKLPLKELTLEKKLLSKLNSFRNNLFLMPDLNNYKINEINKVSFKAMKIFKNDNYAFFIIDINNIIIIRLENNKNLDINNYLKNQKKFYFSFVTLYKILAKIINENLVLNIFEVNFNLEFPIILPVNNNNNKFYTNLIPDSFDNIDIKNYYNIIEKDIINELDILNNK